MSDRLTLKCIICYNQAELWDISGTWCERHHRMYWDDELNIVYMREEYKRGVW